MQKCYFCPSTETKYCSLCEKYFCDNCRKQYGKRIIAMVKEKFAKQGLKWFSKEEVDQMERDGTWPKTNS